jgi:hypothetical protein
MSFARGERLVILQIPQICAFFSYCPKSEICSMVAQKARYVVWACFHEDKVVSTIHIADFDLLYIKTSTLIWHAWFNKAQ